MDVFGGGLFICSQPTRPRKVLQPRRLELTLQYWQVSRLQIAYHVLFVVPCGVLNSCSILFVVSSSVLNSVLCLIVMSLRREPPGVNFLHKILICLHANKQTPQVRLKTNLMRTLIFLSGQFDNIL